MSEAGMLEDFLASACVDAAVFALRPDYRVLLLAVNGIVPGPPGAEQRAGGGVAPSRNAPATAWRRCYAVQRPGCPG